MDKNVKLLLKITKMINLNFLKASCRTVQKYTINFIIFIIYTKNYHIKLNNVVICIVTNIKCRLSGLTLFKTQ